MSASRITRLFEGPDGAQQLVVFVKLTYELPPRGPMRRASADLPLTLETVSEGPDQRFPVGCTLQETDLSELKPWTDVVVRGHVRAAGGRPTPTMDAGVGVGDRCKWVKVVGDRRVQYRRGKLRFSAPKPFRTKELSWRRAYGGVDLSVPYAPVDPTLDLLRRFTPETHPGAYPRNPAGRGWVLHDNPEAIDGMSLPNFESPSQLLDPDRLIVGDRRLWTRRPIPAGFGWWRAGWFPRSARLGDRDSWFVNDAPRVYPPRRDPRFEAGASPGLRFAGLVCGERIDLHGFNVSGSISTYLPPTRPEVQISFERRPLETRQHLATVELLPDAGVANLVWRAQATAPVRLPRRMPRPGQHDYDLLAGVDVVVEGEPVSNQIMNDAQCEAVVAEFVLAQRSGYLH